MHQARISFVALTGLAIMASCGGSEPAVGAEPDATPTQAALPTPAQTPPTKVDDLQVPPPTTLAPATPVPATPVPATPVPATPVTAPPILSTSLHVAALREGPIAIFAAHDAPLLALEGEPVSWVDGAFARNPTGSHGLWDGEPDLGDKSITLAVSGDMHDPNGAWTTTVEEYMRSESIHGVYQRVGDEWQAKDLRKGLLTAFYSSFAERDGALLALQNWAPDASQAIWESDDGEGGEGSPAAKRYQAKLQRALDRAKPSWVRIAGVEGAALPEIPKRLQLGGNVTTTADGTLWAVAETPPADGGDTKPVLLMWPPAVSTAERVAVPELDATTDVVIRSSGEWALVAGRTEEGEQEQSYLAIGRGHEWQRIPVSLPGRPEDAPVHISSAARAPDGALWITLGHPWEGMNDDQPVWHKPEGGEWQPVPLPAVSGGAFGPAKDWTRDPRDESEGWLDIEREQSPAVLGRATNLVWAAGGVWITIDGDRGFEGASEAPMRSVVLTNLPQTAEPVLLPPSWLLLLERRNHARKKAEPGSDQCQHFALVLGPAALATTKPELVTAIAQLAPPDGDLGRIDSIYVGAVDGVEMLVASTHADSPKHASALRKGATVALRALGVDGAAAATDCRVPALVRMVSRLPRS